MNEKDEVLEDEIEIDLRVLFCDMWKGFKKMWLLFLILCVMGMAAGIVYPMYQYHYTPVYRSEASFTISTMEDYSEMDMSYGFYYDSATASCLQRLLPYVLSSDIMQQKLKEKLETESVRGSIQINAVPNSNLFTMQVTSGDAAEAKRILDAALECLPEVNRYIIGDTKLNMIQISDFPEVPVTKSFSKRSILKGLLLGMGVSGVILLAYAFLRRTIRKEEDFRERLNLSCLGVLPQVKFKAHKKQTDQRASILNERVERSFSEAVKSLALKLDRRMKEKNKKVLLVTSAIPGEGKSTVVMNLALALAEEGKRVLLVDMDLRKPVLKEMLKIQSDDKKADLEQVLLGKAAVFESMVKLEFGLSFLGVEKACENTTALITSSSFAEMIETCRSEMDYIIIDTPPCGMMEDAATISESCDAICFVIRQDTAHEGQILEGIQQVTSHGTDIIGGVLNGVENSFSGYGYYGYGRYGKYGYGKYGYGKYGKYGYGKYGYGRYGYGYGDDGSERASHAEKSHAGRSRHEKGKQEL